MDFFADVARLEVLGEIFRQKMAPVRRRVDEDIDRRRGDASVEHDLQRLVAGFARVEGKIVAEHDEAFGPPVDALDDVGKIDEIALVDLDESQSFGRVLHQHRLHQR